MRTRPDARTIFYAGLFWAVAMLAIFPLGKLAIWLGWL